MKIDNFTLVIGDIKTFIWLRSIERKKYHDASKEFGIGGGNFLMTMGCFSIIYLMAKVYFSFRHNHKQTLLEKLFIWLRLNKNLSFKNIDEKKALREFIKDSSVWNLSRGQIKQLMGFYRNPLAHTGNPTKPIVSYDYNLLKNNISDLDNYVMNLNGETFYFEGKKIARINSDLLLRDVFRMKDWLVNL